jgi:hypothetical protein
MANLEIIGAPRRATKGKGGYYVSVCRHCGKIRRSKHYHKTEFCQMCRKEGHAKQYGNLPYVRPTGQAQNAGKS